MTSTRLRLIRRAALLAIALLGAAPAAGLDQVAFRHKGELRRLDGRMLVTAQDGGWLFQGRDGVLWPVPPADQDTHTHDDLPFKPLSADEYSRQLLAVLPKGFEVHQTAHYLIFHDTSKAYAQWCGSLFERLYMAFTNYWTRKGLTLAEPEFPLTAVVFAEKQAYLAHSRPDLGDAAEQMIGYYHLLTNRMTMYDLTGREAQLRGTGRGNTAAAINQLLVQPEAQRTVATVIHEATHQIAFNCGLHTRLSDTPLWFCEGVAMFFETPDLSSAKGWRGVGAVNAARVAQWQAYARKRPRDSLRTLLADDARFRDAKQSLDAYAEAWVLTYFLIHQYPKQYAGYLQTLSAKKPLLEDGPQARLAEFERAFGDWQQVDRDFLRYAARWR
jgi:hypothetical protein